MPNETPTKLKRILCVLGFHDFGPVRGSMCRRNRAGEVVEIPFGDIGNPTVDARLEWKIRCARCGKVETITYETQHR